ncbi:MAG: hypothetical protein VB997_05260 [Opitutales bacterium]
MSQHTIKQTHSATVENLDRMERVVKPLTEFQRANRTETDPEDYEWLRYVATLAPNDERGAFLTPDELLDVNLAYDRLQSFSSDIPRKPSGGKTVAGADDEFIKKKIATAFRRTFEMVNRHQHHPMSGDEDTLISSKTDPQVLRNAITYNLSEGRHPLEGIEHSPAALQLASRYISLFRSHSPVAHHPGPVAHLRDRHINVLNYVRGTITGKFGVLFPQDRTHQVEFKGEPGWKADVEFGADGEKETKTIYARGRCMNVIAGTAYRLQDGLEFDDSKVIFMPDNKEKPMP